MIDMIVLASLFFSVPSSLLVSLCSVESDLSPQIANLGETNGHVSHGLCQIQSRTARDMGYVGTTEGLYDPFTNAFYAAKYLDHQYKRYGTWKDAVAAYNAGHVILDKRGKYVNENYVQRVCRGTNACRR